MLSVSPMKRFLLLALLPISLLAQNPVTTPVSPYKLTARAERPTALYKANEVVSFNIALLDQGKPMASGEVTYVLTKDGLPTDQQGKVSVVDGKAVVQGKLAEPGFLQLRAAYRSDLKAVPVTALAGAGIDVEMIKPAVRQCLRISMPSGRCKRRSSLLCR